MRCSTRGGACTGASGSYCHPGDFWSGSLISSTAGYKDFWLSSGTVGGAGRVAAYAFSVRCIGLEVICSSFMRAVYLLRLVYSTLHLLCGF